jgi:hypothetical protein
MSTILKKILTYALTIGLGSSIFDLLLGKTIMPYRKLLISVIGAFIWVIIEMLYKKYFKNK